MATLKDTPFIAYEFTIEEYPVAVVFTDLQEKHIRTELATATTEKMALAYDPTDPTRFVFEHEYLRGRMEILAYLLRLSDDNKEQAQATIEAQIASQQEME